VRWWGGRWGGGGGVQQSEEEEEEGEDEYKAILPCFFVTLRFILIMIRRIWLAFEFSPSPSLARSLSPSIALARALRESMYILYVTQCTYVPVTGVSMYIYIYIDAYPYLCHLCNKMGIHEKQTRKNARYDTIYIRTYMNIACVYVV
jgi:hypothetical protein